MNKAWRRIKSEWEIALCVLALVSFGAALAFAWSRLHAGERRQGVARQAKRQASVLAPDAYAFLRELPQPTGEEDLSPFLFEGLLKEEKPARPTRVVRTRPKPEPKPEPVAAAPKPRPPEPAPPEPAPRPTVKRYVYGDRDVKYVFSGRSESGRPAATIQLRDPHTGQTAPLAVVPVGGMIDGIRVLAVDQASLTVLDARGTRHRISFGQAARVKSSPRVVEIPR